MNKFKFIDNLNEPDYLDYQDYLDYLDYPDDLELKP